MTIYMFTQNFMRRLSLLFKDIINRLPKYMVYQQNGNNVFLFATRRGGSTILSEVISNRSRKVRNIDQPFDCFDKSDHISKLRRKYLPNKLHSQFLELDEKESIIVKGYVNKLTSGQIMSFEQGLVFRFSKERTVLKIVNASFIASFLRKNFEGKFIYLSRHPASQVISVMKNNWGLTYAANLNNVNWCNKYLNESQLEISEKVDKDGDYFQKCVLNWVFENLYFHKIANFEFLHVNYEDLVLFENQIKQMVSKYIGLDITASDLEKPSRSRKFSDEATKEAIKNRDKYYLINKWESKLSNKQKIDGQLILDVFDISNYNFYDIRPKNHSSIRNSM